MDVGWAVKQVGHGIFRITLPDGTIESYLVTLPRLRIEGLWYGSPCASPFRLASRGEKAG